MNAEKCTDFETLQSIIESMDCMASGGFSDIATIAKLALAAMEAPDAHVNIETYAKAFSVIWGKAEECYEACGSTAEQVGCGYTDTMSEHRSNARRQGGAITS